MIWIAVRREKEQNMKREIFSGVFLMISEKAGCDI
jgi:hypothetical protein